MFIVDWYLILEENNKYIEVAVLMLLNKVLWCLQIQEECLKTLLLVVCVCLEVFEFVNPLFMMIQG